VGDEAVLEVSQIGKVCHTKCAIYYQAGDCVMPREGIFAVVRQGGTVQAGDPIVVERLGEADGTC
jgi:MOSC domain-containing protein YiiM